MDICIWFHARTGPTGATFEPAATCVQSEHQPIHVLITNNSHRVHPTQTHRTHPTRTHERCAMCVVGTVDQHSHDNNNSDTRRWKRTNNILIHLESARRKHFIRRRNTVVVAWVWIWIPSHIFKARTISCVSMELWLAHSSASASLPTDICVGCGSPQNKSRTNKSNATWRHLLTASEYRARTTHKMSANEHETQTQFTICIHKRIQCIKNTGIEF